MRNPPPFPVDRILSSLPGLRVGVLGDFCLDAYWALDHAASELSVETGLPTQPVRRQHYSLGGAGNVVANLRAMGVGQVLAFGVRGDDPFGDALHRLLAGVDADVAGLLIQTQDWDTPTYIKPIREQHEGNRIDFSNFNRLQADVARALIGQLEAALPTLEALIINEQLRQGVHAPCLQELLQALLQRHPGRLVLVDSRHMPERYADCVHKLNAREAARLCGEVLPPDAVQNRDSLCRHATALFARWRQPVFVTNGARGCVVADAGGVSAVDGLHIVRRTDPVGAGDSLLAGVTAALAAGAAPLEAAAFGNFVAGVTVQKCFQTGTASPEEIRAIGVDPDYVYAPELAEDPRQARYVDGVDIECVAVLPTPPRITHAIFDHDGTLSTLREGWEAVMAPMMARAILGAQFANADETVYARVVARVRDFIDKTTGVQTMVQMQGVVDLVQEFGMVPEAERLDAAGHKRVYNEALMAVVRDRLGRLERGERDVGDFTLKHAPLLLARLRAAGVKLFLASGTDEEDLIREAHALGYGDLFEGRIYGAAGDPAREAKRMVLERIVRDIGADRMSQVVTFGDGPVEIRETRKRGGIAVGVASDEVRRFGLNPGKRTRLIRAGAHLVIPDYAQVGGLLRVLALA